MCVAHHHRPRCAMIQGRRMGWGVKSKSVIVKSKEKVIRSTKNQKYFKSEEKGHQIQESFTMENCKMDFDSIGEIQWWMLIGKCVKYQASRLQTFIFGGLLCAKINQHIAKCAVCVSVCVLVLNGVIEWLSVAWFESCFLCYVHLAKAFIVISRVWCKKKRSWICGAWKKTHWQLSIALIRWSSFILVVK